MSETETFAHHLFELETGVNFYLQVRGRSRFERESAYLDQLTSYHVAGHREGATADEQLIHTYFLTNAELKAFHKFQKALDLELGREP